MSGIEATSDPTTGRQPALNVFMAFLRLGLTSFGGPVAHLGYFREEFVARRKWLDERAYADLVALCQFLPGPASSQVGIGIGLTKAGLPGGLAAWIAFTLPSALLMAVFGLGIANFGIGAEDGWLRGLKIVAVAVVAQAVWGMARTLTPDATRGTIAIIAAMIVLLWPTPLGQVGVIIAGGIAGVVLMRIDRGNGPSTLDIRVPRSLAIGCLAMFFGLLAGLPLLSAAVRSEGLAVFDAFYRAGALVFGGGHVVLPLLQAEVVPPGWVSNDQFLAGYGAAQAVPGPLFTFAAYLGVVMGPLPAWLGFIICLLGIFTASFLLLVGALPFWEGLRRKARMQAALKGINAAVVGLLLAALYDPVFVNAIRAPIDVAVGLAAFALLAFWRVPPWAVVIMAAAAGWAVGL